MVHVRAMLRPSPPDTVPLPNGEADTRRLRIGRGHEAAWLFARAGATAAECVVYEVREAAATGFASDPVYVGITSDFAARWSSHRQHSWWFNKVNVMCLIVEGFATREEARRREAALINLHQPRFNTKQERKHLALARAARDPVALFTAEIRPKGRSDGS